MFDGDLVTFQFQGHAFHVHANVLKRLPYIDAATRHGKSTKEIGFANFHRSSATKIVELDWNGFDALLAWAYTLKTDALFQHKSDRLYWEKVSLIMGASELTRSLHVMKWRKQLSEVGEKYWPRVMSILPALYTSVWPFLINFITILTTLVNAVVSCLLAFTSCLCAVVGCWVALYFLQILWSQGIPSFSNAPDLVRLIGATCVEVMRSVIEMTFVVFHYVAGEIQRHTAFAFCTSGLVTPSVNELCTTLIEQSLRELLQNVTV